MTPVSTLTKSKTAILHKSHSQGYKPFDLGGVV